MVIRYNRKRSAVEVGAKFGNCPHQGETLALCDGVILLGCGQETTRIRNNALATMLFLGQNSTYAVATGICPDLCCIGGWVKVGQYSSLAKGLKLRAPFGNALTK